MKQTHTIRSVDTELIYAVLKLSFYYYLIQGYKNVLWQHSRMFTEASGSFASMQLRPRYYCWSLPWVSERGVWPHWILKFSAKKGCFLGFEGEKSKFTTFGSPWMKFGKTLSTPPLEKILPTPMVTAQFISELSIKLITVF